MNQRQICIILIVNFWQMELIYGGLLIGGCIVAGAGGLVLAAGKGFVLMCHRLSWRMLMHLNSI